MIPLHANTTEKRRLKKKRKSSKRPCRPKALPGHCTGMLGGIQAPLLEDVLKELF
jgi:hypothetical protein